MNVAAVVLLAATTVVGAVLWYVADRRQAALTTQGAALGGLIPALLVAAAGLAAQVGDRPDDALLFVGTTLALLAAVSGGGLVATAVLRLADHAPTRIKPGDGTDPTLGSVSDPSTLRGGTWIGALERTAVVVTLLAGWPEGLAVVLAVKGLGRYPELRRPAAAERFIVGTFASVLWAVALAGVAIALRT